MGCHTESGTVFNASQMCYLFKLENKLKGVASLEIL